jgi:hypothetical protein
MSVFCNAVAEGADPKLVASWLCDQSIARDLPEPAADHGGWRAVQDCRPNLRDCVFTALLTLDRRTGLDDRPPKDFLEEVPRGCGG